MSALSKVVIPQARFKIIEATRRTQIDLRGWVANHNYFVDEELEKSSFSLRVEDKGSISAAFANDCNRMAIAAIESMVGLRPEQALAKSGSWGVIRAYYASFFAAQSLLRIFGTSCSQLDNAHLKCVLESASVFGKDAGLSKLDSGFYVVTSDESFSIINFKRVKDSHRDTWKAFLSLLEMLIEGSDKASTLGVYKIQAIDILSGVRNGIRRGRCRDSGNWLSMIRNSVNYRHSHGVWYPYEQRVVAPSCIQKTAGNWSQDPAVLCREFRRGEIEDFFDLVHLIMSVFREILLGCASKADGANGLSPIFANGSIKLLKTLGSG